MQKELASLFMALLLIGCAKSTGDPTTGNHDQGEGDIECLPHISGTLSASAERVISGRPVTLTWSAPRPPGCATVRFFIDDITLTRRTPVSEGGNLAFTPRFATQYELKARSGSVMKTLGTVVVKVTLPKVVYIRGNDYEWRQLLVWALKTPGTTVRLMPEVDMDLTPAVATDQDMGEDPTPLNRALHTPYIFVAAGVTLTGDRVPGEEAASNVTPPAGTAPGGFNPARAVTNIGATAPPTTHFANEIIPGRGGTRLGPRLYRTTGNNSSGQFNLRCFEGVDCSDDVKFSGFRLIGPEFDVTDSVSAVGIAAHSVQRVEISNMELAGWSSQAIVGSDEFDRIQDPQPPHYPLDPNGIHIHGNFIHHNQNDQLGYGALVSAIYGRIERNVFDNNRHAIAGGARAGSGYDANHNLILKGGGHHGGFLGPWDTHQVDVHGTDDCWFSEHNCGDAGTFWLIRNNAFQYARDSGVRIRGKPAIRATIAENVFPYEDEDDALELETREHVNVGYNIYGHDSYAHYAVCDFDGDGRDDLFLATRRNWWYSSAAKMPWVFLREAKEDLADIAVGYFDGDRKCDVIRRIGGPSPALHISSGGTGGWLPLRGSVDMPWSELRFVDMDGDGVTDIFMRRADGTWSVRVPNAIDWRDINISSMPISMLRFARLSPEPANPRNHQRDKVMDVIRVRDGSLAYSRDGVDTWQPLNLSYGSFDVLLFGDLDGNGQDDILRFVPPTDAVPLKWFVSWGGAPVWSPLTALNAPLSVVTRGLDSSPRKRTYFGAFDEQPGFDLLFVDNDRYGNLYPHPVSAIQNRYSLSQY